MSHDEKLLRSSTVMAIGTVASRVTGLVRGLLTVALICIKLCWKAGISAYDVDYALLLASDFLYWPLRTS